MERERKERREAEEVRAKLEERVEQMRKQLGRVEAEAADLNFQVTQAIGQREAVKRDLEAARRETEQVRTELGLMTERAGQMEERAVEEGKLAAALQGKLSALRAMIPAKEEPQGKKGREAK